MVRSAEDSTVVEAKGQHDPLRGAEGQGAEDGVCVWGHLMAFLIERQARSPDVRLKNGRKGEEVKNGVKGQRPIVLS